MKHDETAASLQRIEELLTALVKEELADVMEEELDDPKKKKIFRLTGNYSASEIAKKAKTSPRTVSALWRRWDHAGLLTRDAKRYRKVI